MSALFIFQILVFKMFQSPVCCVNLEKNYLHRKCGLMTDASGIWKIKSPVLLEFKISIQYALLNSILNALLWKHHLQKMK